MIVAGSASPLLLSSAGGYNLTKSLRFRSSASAYLDRTFANAGNRRTYTLSLWLKRGSLDGSTNQFFFGSGVSTTAGGFYFLPTNQLEINPRVNNTNTYITTTQVFRDPSAWYHIVVALDTTQATDSNRLKLYINGVQVTAFSTTIYPALNGDSTLNNNIAHWIGRYPEPGFPSPFDGYLAEVNFINGQALTPSSFGETSTTTGVWIPKKFSGTYGTNGFYLPFTDTTSTSTLGTDFSGNSNTWTVNNISLTAGTTYDSMNDVPTLTSATTANYAVMNPLDQLDGSIAGGNLNVTTGTVGGSNCRGTMAMTSGKFYWEFTPTTNGGIADLGISIFPGSDPKNGTLYTYQADTGNKYSTAGGGVSYGSTYTTNDVIGIAYDATTGSIWWAKNGTFQASGDPASGTNAAFTGITGNAFPFITDRNVGGTCVVACNFGQRPFSYTPPTGFVALNTFNLTTPTIGATASTQAGKYFNTVLYTGNGSAGKTVTGVGFQPDFTWIKSRSDADSHYLVNNVAGYTKYLLSNSTQAEVTNSNIVTSSDSDGFTVGSSGAINGNTATYVAWNWKANGTGSTNTAGSITSTVSANTTAGFSIVTYTASSSASTIGHGLGVAPSMIIQKNRDAVSDWGVYHISVGATKFLKLNDTAAAATNSVPWNDTTPTSTVFSIGTGYTNGNKYVAYCFAQVAGYSAFGSYTGNGSSDGPFVFTGFRPKWLLIKSSSVGGVGYIWTLVDSARNTYNVMGKFLSPDTSSAETTYAGWDFLSNGFKLRNTSNTYNESGQTFIYMAFAENPFKYANAR